MSDADREQCRDCGAVVPATNSELTLVSSIGWRITRRSEGGRLVVEWRCPGCWAKHKATRGPSPAELAPASGIRAMGDAPLSSRGASRKSG